MVSLKRSMKRLFVLLVTLCSLPFFASAYSVEELLQGLSGRPAWENTFIPDSGTSIGTLLDALSGISPTAPATTSATSTPSAPAYDYEKLKHDLALANLVKLLAEKVAEWTKLRASTTPAESEPAEEEIEEEPAPEEETELTEPEEEFESSQPMCPELSRILKRGMQGGDVLQLQQFLAASGDTHADLPTTGFFGAKTEAAVQWWQSEHDIVSSGSPATTGYGVVGPKTIAAILDACSDEPTDEPTDEPFEEEDFPEEEFEEEFPEEELLDTFPECEISVTPENIIEGDDATLSWTTTNATSAVIAAFGTVELAGSRVVSPNDFVEYVLSVKSEAGEENECSAYLEVELADAWAEILAEPEMVDSGDSATITWETFGGTFCELTGGGLYSNEHTGSLSTGALTADTTYTISCSSRIGPQKEEITVYVDSPEANARAKNLANAYTALRGLLERLKTSLQSH